MKLFHVFENFMNKQDILLQKVKLNIILTMVTF